MKKLEFNQKSSGQSWYNGMFRIGRESLKRDSRNTFGKSEEFSVKNRCVALRCVVTRKKQRLVASIGEFRRRSEAAREARREYRYSLN